MVLVKDYISTQFHRLITSTPISLILKQFHDQHNYTYILIVNEHNEPISLITFSMLKDLIQNTNDLDDVIQLQDIQHLFPPLVRVQSDVRMDILVNLPVVVNLIDIGIIGWLIEEDHLMGILTIEHIDQYLNNHYEPSRKILNPFSPSVLGLLPIICAICKVTNKISFFDRDSPPKCINNNYPYGEHDLVPGWLIKGK